MIAVRAALLGIVLALLTAPCLAQNHFKVTGAGADVGNCSAASPCRTINYATHVALTTNANSMPEYIDIGPGGWNESVTVTGSSPGAGSTGATGLIYQGAGSSLTVWNGAPNSCGTLIVNGGGVGVGVRALGMAAQGNACQSALFAQLGGVISVLDDFVFGFAAQQHMHAEGPGSQIQIWNSYSVLGGASIHAAAVSGGFFEINPGNVVVTFAPGVNFTKAFANPSVGGIVYLGHSTSYAGAVSGRPYYIEAGGILYTDGAGCPSVPGTPGTGYVDATGICR